MGMFGPMASIYVVFAIVFMVLAIGFVALDVKCKSNRQRWVTFTAVTGPIGLFGYLFFGRNK